MPRFGLRLLLNTLPCGNFPRNYQHHQTVTGARVPLGVLRASNSSKGKEFEVVWAGKFFLWLEQNSVTILRTFVFVQVLATSTKTAGGVSLPLGTCSQGLKQWKANIESPRRSRMYSRVTGGFSLTQKCTNFAEWRREIMTVKIRSVIMNFSTQNSWMHASYWNSPKDSATVFEFSVQFCEVVVALMMAIAVPTKGVQT